VPRSNACQESFRAWLADAALRELVRGARPRRGSDLRGEGTLLDCL